MKLIAMALMLVTTGSVLAAPQYDVVIRGARLLDGTGTPWYYADVAVKSGRIVAVGKIPTDRSAANSIDGTGLYLAPGFIDAHSHAWPAIGKADRAGAAPLLTQGVTTVFANPDGFGPTDLVTQRSQINAAGPGINVALMIGHNSVRKAVMGEQARDPTPQELDRMRELVRKGMRAGAFGLSAGPFYTPGNFSKTEEHIALAKVAAQYDGFYTSHIRDESRYSIGLVAAVDEVVRIAREGGLPGIVSHIKSSTPACWGLSKPVIEHINAARDAGVQVFADQYPYDASNTDLGALLVPAAATEGGDEALHARLSDPGTLAPIRAAMASNLERRGGPSLIEISAFPPDRSLEGHRLDEIAKAKRRDPVDEAVEIVKAGDASVISFTMSEDDIRAFMSQPWTMTSTDGDLPEQDDELVHPRGFGTFPRKLHKYALDEHVISLTNAIHSMTGLTATVLHLRDRGVIREGAWADLVLFDAATIRDVATYEKPLQLSEGIRYVLVNGELALSDGRVTGKRAGRVLSRAAR